MAGYLKICTLVVVLSVSWLGNARAGSTFLGNAASYNVWAFGSGVIQNGGDFQGAVATSGNFSSSSSSVATNASSSTGDSLVVGGTTSFSNGQVNNGNIRGVGTVSFSGAGLPNGTIYYGTQAGNSIPSYITSTYVANAGLSSTFFSSTQNDLTHKSAELAAQTANGTVSGSGTLTLSGTNSNTNYFTLTAQQLAGATTGDINAPANSTVIVNVSGTSVSEKDTLSISGTAASNVLFNFYQAKSLTLSNISFGANILAPDAILYGSNGNADGNTIVAGVSDNNSGFEFHNADYFTGTPLLASVPEPSSLVMMGLSSGFGLLIFGRRALARRVS